MLTHTSYYVKTNFGPINTFRTSVGVIQGSGGSPIHHINHTTSGCTSKHSRNVRTNKTTQLFADDVTLLATKIATFKLLIALTLAWITDKHGQVTHHAHATPSDQLKFAFRVVKDLTLLGAAIVPNGVMNPTILDLRVVMPLISKIQVKIKAVLISSHYKRLRLDVAVHLIASQAMSVLKYILPIIPHNGIA